MNGLQQTYNNILTGGGQLLSNIGNAVNNNVIHPTQQAIYNWGVQNPQQTSQILQAPRQIQQGFNTAVNFVGQQRLPINNVTPFKFQMPTVGQTVNTALPNLQSSAIGQLYKGNFNQVIPSFNKTVTQANKNTFGTNVSQLQKIASTPNLTPQQILAQVKQATPFGTTQVNNVLLAGTGASDSNFSKEQIQMYKSGFTKEVRDLVGQFTTLVQSGKGRNELGQLGDYVHSLGETVFGKDAANLTSKQLANAFDSLGVAAGKSNVKPVFNIGLGTKNVEHTPVANAGITNDFAEQQQLKNSIAEGQNILKSGKDTLGNPLSEGQKQMISRTIQNAQDRIGTQTITQAYGIPHTMQELSYDQVTNRANGVAPQDLAPQGLKNWKALVNSGEAKVVDGKFYRNADVPNVGQAGLYDTKQPFGAMNASADIKQQGQLNTFLEMIDSKTPKDSFFSMYKAPLNNPQTGRGFFQGLTKDEASQVWNKAKTMYPKVLQQVRDTGYNTIENYNRGVKLANGDSALLKKLAPLINEQDRVGKAGSADLSAAVGRKINEVVNQSKSGIIDNNGNNLNRQSTDLVQANPNLSGQGRTIGNTISNSGTPQILPTALESRVAQPTTQGVAKFKAEYPDSTNNPLYQDMRKAQDTLMAKVDTLRGKYKTDAEFPAPLKKELDTLKADWQAKAKTWEDTYVTKSSVAQPTIGEATKVTPITPVKPVSLHDQYSAELTKGVKMPQAVDKGPLVNIGQDRPAVKTQAAIKAEIRGNSEPLPWEANQSGKAIANEGAQLKTNPTESLGKSEATKTPLDSFAGESSINKVTGQSGIDPLQKSFADIINRKGINVKEKVGLLDYFRTPDRVLQKIGMGEHMTQLRGAYDTYQKQLPQEIQKITDWSKQVSSPESNQQIFKYLDGQGVQLNPQDLKVANEVKSYLASWADKLGLPKDSRISNYITHIFDRQLVQKEFDPEIASLIRDKVAGSVYDPFTQERLGKSGYVEDTWRALDAYTKRAVRKVNLDPALERISQRASSLEDSQYNYVKSFIDRVNMRPTQIDNLLDNTIKQAIGYKFGQRPTTVITRNLRQAVFRGTLGLNPGSALKNLTQGANTYAKLGEKYTVVGYTNLIKDMLNGSKELNASGLLGKDLVQDRTLTATKQVMQTVDKGLFAFFEGAEKINRGAAYFGAKAKGIAQGMSEPQAIDFAKKTVRDTQFQFSAIDTPPILQSDLGKLFLQFQSFPLKQTEFLASMAKSKDVAGLIRYFGASTLMALTVGKLFGMSPQDIIPFAGVTTGQTKLGQTPPIKLASDLVGAAVGSKGTYGQDLTLKDRVSTIGNDLVPFIPAGVQIKKTLGGVSDVLQGYHANQSGNVQYPIQNNPQNVIRAGLFGTNNLPAAQDYRNSGQKPLTPTQTNFVKNSTDLMGTFNSIMNQRQQNAATKAQNTTIKASGTGAVSGNTVKYLNNGKVATIDLNPPTAGQGIDAFTNQNWNVTKALEVWKAQDKLTKQGIDVNAIYKQLGVDPQDVRYAYLASHSTDVSTQYIESKSPDHQTLLNNLSTGRVVGIGGQQFANNAVIDNFYNKGLISKSEATALKNTKTDKTGKSLSVAKVSAGKKISVKSLPKIPKLKLVSPKIAKVKAPRASSYTLKAPKLKIAAIPRFGTMPKARKLKLSS